LVEAAMEAIENLVHGRLSRFSHAKLGWRGAIAAVMNRLLTAWVGLYAAPPRRALPSL